MNLHLARTVWLGLLLLGIVACNRPRTPALVDTPSVPMAEETLPRVPLYVCPLPAPLEPAVGEQSGVAVDPVVIHDCRLTVIDKQEVPSQRDGVMLVVGTELRPGERVPADRVISIRHGDAVKTYKRLKEDDVVEGGQLLAQLDDEQARDEWDIKKAKLTASKAELLAAEKTRDEAKTRYETKLSLYRAGNAAPLEEVRATKLTWERYVHEVESKQEAVKLAELERNQAQTLLRYHQIRTAIPGVVKAIHKKRGEAVKNMEPVFQIHDLSRLRIEGQLAEEHALRLRKGMTAIVEPSRLESPEQTFVGHLQEVSSVAVSRDSKLIVSAGEDGTMRVWSRTSRFERRVLPHPSPVRAVACTPAGTGQNWCLSGGSDGIARLWDLDAASDKPFRELPEEHKAAITCVAFSPDGKWCATGADDRDICLWETATGDLKYRLPDGHRAAVTALQFTPQSQLVSAGRDNTVRVWDLTPTGARLRTTIDRRSGDVAQPGVSPDGRRVLLDQGKALRLLTLAEQRTEGILENTADATRFSAFALFSPDGRLVLTAGAAEGKLQLWRGPTAVTRPYELRQLVTRNQAIVTCAAFAPDGSFLVVGTKDRQVLVWPLPSKQEVERELTAELSLVEQAVESTARQVRVWAEVKNPEDPARRLLPGTSVTLSVYPTGKRTDR